MANPSATIDDMASIAKRYGISGVQSDDAVLWERCKAEDSRGRASCSASCAQSTGFIKLEEKLEEELEDNQQLDCFMILKCRFLLFLQTWNHKG